MRPLTVKPACLADLVEVHLEFGWRTIIEIEQIQRLPDHLVTGVAIHGAGHLVAVDDRPLSRRIVRIEEQDRIRRVLEQQPEALLALASGGLGLFALGDISVDAQHQLAPINLYERCRYLNGKECSVLPAMD